jgi:pimeloyl-ACP methyl ester carboxylesterase
MRQKILISALVSAFVVLASGARANAQENTGEGNYAAVNGLNLYYEVHGTGEPLILLHGGLGGIAEFSQLLPLLAETRQIIAVELQAHGHTTDIDRPLSYEAMADDIAALVEYLGFENVDIMGFSLGGGVALQTAIRHPEVARKLVLISTAFRRDERRKRSDDAGDSHVPVLCERRAEPGRLDEPGCQVGGAAESGL